MEILQDGKIKKAYPTEKSIPQMTCKECECIFKPSTYEEARIVFWEKSELSPASFRSFAACPQCGSKPAFGFIIKQEA